MSFPLSVMILTKDEEVNIAACLDCLKFSDDVVVYDSYSTDGTLDIARQYPNVSIVQRKFDNWAAHQNWGMENIPFKHPWVLYVDADERIDRAFIDEATALADPASAYAAWRMRRKDMFMGRWLKHAQLYPTWFVRVFRPEKIRFERLVNPIPIVDGKVGEMREHLIHYPFSKGLVHWFERHNSYSGFEAQEQNKVAGGSGQPVSGIFSGDPNKRRAALKDIFFRLPMRPQIKWLYYVLWRRAFLDGKAGMRYARLQAIYEHMIQMKAEELRMKESGQQL